MAYPVVSAPYGFKPINLVGGLPFAGATRALPIASAYSSNIFNGDDVLLSDGSIILSTLANDTSPVAGLIGVFLGCSYTNPSTKQKVYSQYWPASTVASDAIAYIAENPNTLYQVVLVSGTTVNGSTTGLQPAYLGASAVGSNAAIVRNTGLTTSGDSRVGIYTATGSTTSSLPVRIVDVVPETANSSGNFCEFIVRFNFGYHSYEYSTGS